MEWAGTPGELRAVTIDDVISPVPMNPSCMVLSCRFQTEARTDLERSSKELRLVFVSILSDDGGADTSRVVGNSSRKLLPQSLSGRLAHDSARSSIHMRPMMVPYLVIYGVTR
jgi:hypothetical protein